MQPSECAVFHFHHCAYGEPYKKPTTLFTDCAFLGPLSKTCDGTHSHSLLVGKTRRSQTFRPSQGSQMTILAQTKAKDAALVPLFHSLILSLVSTFYNHFKEAKRTKSTTMKSDFDAIYRKFIVPASRTFPNHSGPPKTVEKPDLFPSTP